MTSSAWRQPRFGRRQTRSFRTARYLILIFLVIVLGWGIGFHKFASTIPDALPPATEKTDAIVVLTGGAGRVQEGLSLLESGAAAKLFVSGVYRGVDVQALLKVAQRSPGNLECCVVLGYAADSTKGNAEETAEWIRREGITSIRLVTASYHMPRSLLEFRQRLPADVRVLPHAVFPEQFRQSDWWRWWGSGWLAVSEYHKFLLALAVRELGAAE